MVEAYSSISLETAVYDASDISLCLSYLVKKEKTLSMGIVLEVLSMCLLYVSLGLRVSILGCMCMFSCCISSFHSIVDLQVESSFIF